MDKIIDKINQAISQSRLNSLAVMLTTDRSERLARIEEALARPPAAGSGPAGSPKAKNATPDHGEPANPPTPEAGRA